MLRGYQPFAQAPDGLAQCRHPDRHDDPRYSDGEIRSLPTLQAERREGRIGIGGIPGTHDPPAEEDPDASTDVDPARIDGQDGGAHRGPEVVGQHRERRRRCAGLADADPDAVGRQRREAAGGARERGHQAPEPDADGDKVLARPGVRQPAQGDAEDGVEDRERRAVEETDLGVGNAEVGLNLLGEDRHDLPVDEVEDIDDDEDDRDVPRVASADLRRVWLLWIGHRLTLDLFDASLAGNRRPQGAVLSRPPNDRWCPYRTWTSLAPTTFGTRPWGQAP